MQSRTDENRLYAKASGDAGLAMAGIFVLVSGGFIAFTGSAIAAPDLHHKETP